MAEARGVDLRFPRALFAAAFLVAAGCTRPGGAPASDGGGAAIAALAQAHARDAWVECRGTVERVLRDDTSPPRHERFILRVAGGDGETILVAHNIDLAPRVPLAPGDTVTLRGEYEWNPEGGVVHETHHATSARAASSGWVRAHGTTYQ